MKNLPAFTLSLFLVVLGLPSLVVAQEKDDFKVASVNIQRVFQEFHKTIKAEKDVNEERIRIQKLDRKARAMLQRVDRDLHEQNQAGIKGDLSDEEKKGHTDDLSRKVDERNRLNQERMARYESSSSQLNRDMGNTMRGILGEIRRFVESHAEKNGYDVVFDISGTTTNQLPAVLGGKGMVDITATVLAALNKGEPTLKEKR